MNQKRLNIGEIIMQICRNLSRKTVKWKKVKNKPIVKNKKNSHAITRYKKAEDISTDAFWHQSNMLFRKFKYGYLESREQLRNLIIIGMHDEPQIITKEGWARNVLPK